MRQGMAHAPRELSSDFPRLPETRKKPGAHVGHYLNLL